MAQRLCNFLLRAIGGTPPHLLQEVLPVELIVRHDNTAGAARYAGKPAALAR